MARNPAADAATNVGATAKDITKAASEALSPPQPLPTMTAIEAAHRIRALYETARTLSELIEAQVMEALWVIHRDIPDAEFDDFIAAHTPLRPASARHIVLTWDVARRNRELRDLTTSRPSEALNLVRGFIDAGGDAEEIQQFSEDDRAVVEVLSLPPRRRNEALRSMLQARRVAAAGRNSYDVARIEALEAQIADRSPVTAPLIKRPAAQWQDAMGGLQRTESSLQGIADEMEELAGSAAPPAQIRARLTAITDMAMGNLERIAGLALES